jgi:hypothetical protein
VLAVDRDGEVEKIDEPNGFRTHFNGHHSNRVDNEGSGRSIRAPSDASVVALLRSLSLSGFACSDHLEASFADTHPVAGDIRLMRNSSLFQQPASPHS